MAANSPFLTAARAAAETAARHAREADLGGRLPGEVAEAVREAGFSRRFVPGRWGGEDVSFAEFTEAVATLGAGCVSAAWIGSLWAYTARFAAYLPVEGQQEVWAKGPETRIVSALAPSGGARPVADGWVLDGVWPYTSGIEHSDWALVVGPAPAKDGPPARFFAVPRDQYTVEESWRTVGMRATGSHSLVLRDVFVPGYRAFGRAEMYAGEGAHSPEGVHRLPLRAVNGLTFAAPLLGAARAALASCERLRLPDRRTGSTAPAEALARAAGLADAGALLLGRAARTADLLAAGLGEGGAGAEGGSQLEGGAATQGGAEEGAGLVARAGRDCALAVELLLRSVDTLQAAAGTRGQSRDEPLERIWRDVHTAGSHVALRFDTAAAVWASAPPVAPARI
ncbi:acyl-CoA dehydrogenase [Streptomyces sp. NPDC003717]|uniref:acyl-CoA dehydrogenase n=1 Tax=Streptomyces sp. NPDC003717 TaxID=3154276 RepID=UPI00339DA8B0